jgi:uncharacterized membrane protein
MIEIPVHYHQAITRVIAVIVPALVVALLLLRRLDAPRRRRVLLRAVILGALCAVASLVVYTSRGAGTGTQTAWGWPRVVFSLWQSWETGQRSHGIRWQGLIENAAFYGALAGLLGALLARRRDVAPASRAR